MSPELHKRTGDLFHRLRLLPKHQRQSVLDLACQGEPELRSEVIALLEADELAGDSFLDRPALEDMASLLASASSLEPPITGTIAQRYRAGPRIGSGGMGVVYQAEDLRLSRPVALKVLSSPMARDADSCRRFEREARAASQLNHPNITAIHDAGVDSGVAFIAMELVEGRTLRQIIADGALPDAATVMDILRQTGSALDAAHKAGIVHRDIKPENIMVRPDGLVKVLDFGLARSSKPKDGHDSTLLTRPGEVPGTIQYLSPEQVLGQTPGPTSDIFSLGVVGYEFATGARPFDGPTDGAVFDAILHRQPKRPSQVRPSLGPDLDAVIMGALEKDPQLRFQSVGELKRHFGPGSTTSQARRASLAYPPAVRF